MLVNVKGNGQISALFGGGHPSKQCVSFDLVSLLLGVKQMFRHTCIQMFILNHCADFFQKITL